MLKDEIKTRMLEAMKAKRTVEKDILRVALGEIQSLASREGREPGDEEVVRLLRKLMNSAEETRAATRDEAMRARLGQECEVLAGFLPQTLTTEQIEQALAPVQEQLLAAPGDGPATGIAMKHLKREGAAVEGRHVGEAVRRLRAMKGD